MDRYALPLLNTVTSSAVVSLLRVHVVPSVVCIHVCAQGFIHGRGKGGDLGYS